MAPNSREWSLPPPVRALLWWPGFSFVLVIVAPEIAGATILAAGTLLAVIGGLVSAISASLSEQAGGAHRATASTSNALDGPTVEITSTGIRTA